jgi:hypothetical protein
MKAACWTVIGWCVIYATAGALPLRAADITDDQFNALKEIVRVQGENMQKLSDEVKQLHQDHAADQQIHQKDMEQIQQLQQTLQAQQSAATNAPKEAVETVVEAAPLPRVPIDEATVNHNFSVLGDAEFQFANIRGQHPTFLFADFAPIFLYRGGENVLFEAGFDFTLQNGAAATHDSDQTTGINLSFAQLNYVLNDYATLAVGNLLLPLGTYSLRTAGWLNKIPDDPLARDLLPGTGVGGQVLGAKTIGSEGKILNYAVWGVNGPGSSDGTGAADQLDLGGNVGLSSDNRVTNLHGNPSGGARIGFFYPFKPHYDLEVGLSGQSGEWDDQGNHRWNAAVVDASLHLGSYFETKGEFVNTWYGSDTGNIHPEGWWIQTGYKLAGLNLSLPLVNNVEVVGRYDLYHDGLGTHKRRETVGYIYYLSNTLLFEGVYEFFHGNSTDPNEKNRLILQLSYGF